MTSGRWRKAGVGVVAVASLGAGAAPTAMTAAAGREPVVTYAAGSDWPTVGGSLDNSRHSPLRKIDTRNVRRLGGAWFRELESNSRTPPIVVDGVMYLNDATSIYAIDASTGAIRWRYRPPASTPARGGVALGGDLLFCGLVDTHVIALRRATGELVWTSFIGNSTKPSGVKISAPGVPDVDPAVGIISSAPTYVDGVVVIGLSGGDFGARGKVSGLDAETGRVLWNFNVIPRPGEPGSETWPEGGGALDRGGGAVWTQGPADPELGLVYYGTGNAVPISGGETRPGDNLYNASVIALDVRTGKLRWHYQLVHHDLWEMDASVPLVLFDLRDHGRLRRGLAAMRTDGYLFLFDRETGKPLFEIVERPVPQDVRLRTSPTQPFPVGFDQLGPNCVPREIAPPGFRLGCYFDPLYFDHQDVLTPLITTRFAPMSYDPKSGYFVAMGSVTPWWLRRVENPYVAVAALPPDSKEYGVYAAIDGRTGKIAWQRRSPWGLARGSGALTTAGGLMFHMEGDGHAVASDTRTGDVLWRFQTGYLGPAAITLAGGVPFASYVVRGEQYVAAPMGKGLWAFKLGGKLQPRPAPTPPPTTFGFAGVVEALGADGLADIAIGALAESFYGAAGGVYTDEFAFVPVRARVKAGTPLRFTNFGVRDHTLASEDGSWSTPTIRPGQSVVITIDKPGTYVYSAREFPFSRAQLFVE
jgi:glucose dehydrogenase/plastocyanin